MTGSESHLLHEDLRNEAARVRKLEAHEAEVRRLIHERWWRRSQALMPVTDEITSGDFDGCVE